MESTPPKQVPRKTKSFRNSNHPVPTPLPILSSTSSSQLKPIIQKKQSEMFISLSKAANKLLSQITSECSRRITSIKKSTSEAISQITALKSSISQLYKSSSLHALTLSSLKSYSSSASTYYKPQCEEFTHHLESLIKDYSALEQSLVSDSSVNKEKGSKWGVVKNGNVLVLPDWVISQINIGENQKIDIVNIFKKSKQVSLADLKNKKYFGITSEGNLLPPQTLVKIS